ncbi:MAG: flagellar hook-associated protein FlgK [Tissierellia bacterium]|nr:flagellar hook-associated protein FlgK [Tissierellia bacterium]
MFYGLNSAVRGLLASQRALYTTNHNINNANTDGYSRQQVEQRATDPFRMPGIGFLGTGTEIYNIQRVRDAFVDFKYWNETAPLGEWEIKKNSLTEIEKLMGEPSNSSFRKYLDDFYTSLEELSKNPSDLAFREPVRENALAFTKHINETATRLMDMQKEVEYNIDMKVSKINSIVEQIGALNRQIYSQELDGSHANDLRDRREVLVDELSKIVNVRVNESPAGKYTVSVEGISIVDHLYVNKVVFNKDGNDGEKLTWENGGIINLKSGELKGLIDVYEGNGENNTYRGIPYYIDKLNEFAKGFAEGFNSIHKQGYGLGSSANGINFFVGLNNETDDITAATLTLSEEIMKDVKNISVAGVAGGLAEDNTNLLKLIAQREDKEFFTGGVSQGTPDDFIKSILSSMAVDSLQSKRLYETQELIQKNIETKRSSISGVNLDEEMADMVRFQHVYVASSKMISTMDMIIDVTVNRLGLVGR